MRLSHVIPATALAAYITFGLGTIAYFSLEKEAISQTEPVIVQTIVAAAEVEKEVTVPMPDQITSTETPVVTAATTKPDEIPKEPDYRTLTVKVTAYTAKCNGCSGRTFTGVDVRNTTTYKGLGVISVDPKVIPLGSKVEIDGKMFTAQDTGGAIKGNKIDMLMSNYDSAMDFGRQTKQVKVYKN